ncbi:MAG: WD40 repeat domain-containing protein [Gemmataceae bacterium]|nr:WD40 repeat domain-containing protein [Gemmataceae bacterium]
MRIFQGHTAPVTCVAFSRDGLHVLSGSEDMTVRRWEVATGNELRCFRGHQGRLLAVSQAGQQVVSASVDRTVRTWNPETGQESAPAVQLHDAGVVGAVFSEDGSQALVWGYEHFRMRPAGVFDVINATRRGVTPPTEVPEPDPRTLSVRRYEEGEPREGWTAANGADEQYHAAAFTNAGPLVLGSVRVDDHHFRLHADAPSDVCAYAPFHTANSCRVVGAFSPSGTRLLLSCLSSDARGTDCCTLRLWNLTTPERLSHAFRGHTQVVTCVLFAPEEPRALSGAEDNTVRLWDVDSGCQVDCFEGHSDSVTCLAFSPDSRRAISGGRDGTLHLWPMPALTPN